MARSTALSSSTRSSCSGRRIRKIAAGKAIPPLPRRPVEPEGDFLDLLILEEAPDQFRPRIDPVVPLARPGEEHLDLEANQPAGEVQIVGRLVQTQRMNRGQELIGYSRDRDVRDVDLLLAKEVQEQVERTRKRIQSHHEPAVLHGATHRGPGLHDRHPKMFHPVPAANGTTRPSNQDTPHRAGARRREIPPG